MVKSPVSVHVLAVLTLDDKSSQNDKTTVENLSFCKLPTAFDYEGNLCFVKESVQLIVCQ